MKDTFTFSAVVHKEEDHYVSFCLELDVSGQGETIEEAVSDLKEAVEIYIEEEGITFPIKRPFVTTFKVTGKKIRTRKTEKNSEKSSEKEW